MARAAVRITVAIGANAVFWLDAVIAGAPRSGRTIRIDEALAVRALGVPNDFGAAALRGDRAIGIRSAGLFRVPKDANFVVLQAADSRYAGRKTKDILRKLRGRTFECEVDYMHRDTPKRIWTKHHIALRLVAIWHPDRKCHQQYLSNVCADQLAAADVPAIYAMRWEIELLFRELKSQLSIDQIPSGNKAAADAFIYAALLVLAIGRRLHRALQCRGKGLVDRFPFERWSSILRQIANDLLHVVLAPASQCYTLSRRLALLLRYEGKDPNRHRLLLKARAQLGVLAH